MHAQFLNQQEEPIHRMGRVHKCRSKHCHMQIRHEQHCCSLPPGAQTISYLLQRLRSGAHCGLRSAGVDGRPVARACGAHHRKEQTQTGHSSHIRPGHAGPHLHWIEMSGRAHMGFVSIIAKVQGRKWSGVFACEAECALPGRAAPGAPGVRLLRCSLRTARARLQRQRPTHGQLCGLNRRQKTPLSR